MIKVPSNFIKAITATNAMKMIASNIGKTILCRPYAVTHVCFSQSDTYFEDNIDTAELDNLITTYWTQKYGGVIPSAQTVTQVRMKFLNVMSTATRMVGRFLCLKRVQDQFNINNDDIGKIGKIFTDPRDTNIFELQGLIRTHGRAYDIIADSTNAHLQDTNTIWGDIKISSAEWSRTFTGKLKNIYLPVPVLELLNLLMAGTIELSSDDDETLRYVCVWMPGDFVGDNFPSNLYDGSVENFLNGYNSDYEYILEAYSDYPIIKDIMIAMGYKAAIDYVDVRRDLSGQTLSVVRDQGDQLEYSLKSVLLAQVDVRNDTDRYQNSCIIRAKGRYLPEIIVSSDFNAVCTDLYNVENFVRGRLTTICVSMIIQATLVNGDRYRAIETHCGDNLGVYSDSHATPDWTRAILTSVDAVTETDALIGNVRHDLAISDTGDITIHASELEASARTFMVSEGDIRLLIGCVLSAFYVNVPDALSKLTGQSTFAVREGVSTVTYYGDKSVQNTKSDKKKKDSNNKDKKQNKSNVKESEEKQPGSNDSNPAK